MEPTLLATLLASIETDTLVIVCGAGLSRTAPSRVPAASDLASTCARKFTQSTGLPVPDGSETDLEMLARFLFQDPTFWRLFLERLVEWGPFTRGPNSGHFAIADLLCSGAVRFAITTNFDALVEVSAEELGEPLFRASLDGNQMQPRYEHRSILKLHGCMRVDLNRTVWCALQSAEHGGDPVVRERLESSETWLAANLPGCHLLIVGFWSDWPHLNDALSRALNTRIPAAITLVDINDDDHLRQKAPALWDVAERLGPAFKRVRVSGADFLDELRKEHSLRFFDRVLRTAVATYVDLGGVTASPVPILPTDLSADELYELRRDICGVAPKEIVRDHSPSDKMRGVGAVHLLLQERGAQFSGTRYETPNGIKIRVVNGASDSLHRVKARFSKEQPASYAGEVVIYTSTIDDGGVPANIVREDSSRTNDIFKGVPQAEWISLREAREKGFC